MKLSKNLHWFLYILFPLACARQTTPTGGPKDSIPPILLQSVPYHEQTNFTGKQLQLTFNESLILNNPKDQIIITPNVGKDFETTLRKNTVIVQFKNDLEENTTYSINFRDAIQDITEKNPTKNVQLAFSTGDYIDSLSISGTVYDMLTGKELKDATIGLYQQDTFNIFKHRPTYISKSDDKGKYQIGNLKPGTYQIYVSQDDNKNLIVDSKSESYGYLTGGIELIQNQKDVNIPLISLDARPLKLTSARPSASFYNIKATKNISSYHIKAGEGQPVFSAFGQDHENVRIYNPGTISDSLKVNFHALDSMSNVIDTTLYVKFSQRELKPEAFTVTNEGFSASGVTGHLTGKINVNKPLLAINTDSIYYQLDTLTIIPFTSKDITYDTIRGNLTFLKTVDKTLFIKKPTTTVNTTQRPKAPPLKTPAGKPTKETKPPAIENQLYIGGHTFISIESDTSKKILVTLQPTTTETTGTLLAQVNTKELHFIVQVISKDKVVASSRDLARVTFEDLAPGEYQLRLIIDRNNDGKWSPGNFFKREEPEPVIFYKNEKKSPSIGLKANWELGPLLITF
ncbi:MAG TPA: Ig-like domain-containing protein [Chryseolinea sp.]|nr:Ig-like domain-containing protein [Chryseolinea sp.]